MHWIIFGGIFGLLVIPVRAQTMVPDSTSPDGRSALYYQHASTQPVNEGYTFAFREAHSLRLVSDDLAPKRPRDLTTSAALEAFDEKDLFDMIGSHFEGLRAHVIWEPAFTYDVTWSPDSQWVSISGGAHKFWHMEAYHLIRDRFHLVSLPFWDVFSNYFHAHVDHLQIQPQGVAEAIRKVSPRTYDMPEVCWMGNGLLAIHARVYLLNDPEYAKVQDPTFYYLVDCRTDPPTITDLCR